MKRENKKSTQTLIKNYRKAKKAADKAWDEYIAWKNLKNDS